MCGNHIIKLLYNVKLLQECIKCKVLHLLTYDDFHSFCILTNKKSEQKTIQEKLTWNMVCG